MLPPYMIFPQGDGIACFQLGNTISEVHHQKLLAMQQWLQAKSYPYIIDTITAYHTLSVAYDLVFLRLQLQQPSAFAYIRQLLEEAYASATPALPGEGREIAIPVCYEPAYGPDMEALAAEKGASVEDLIHWHTRELYRVYMIGFLPGFPYLGVLPEILFTARRATPRLKVPAGAVGIAGYQTGIYPVESPGGWNIIGRTPMSLFNRCTDPPWGLVPGDRVRFYAISEKEMERWSNK